MAKFDGKKILIVEDDNLLAEMLAKKYIGENALIGHATNGEDAISMIKLNKYDLILLDLLLPKVNGFEVLEAINLGESTKGTPVIILSNLGQKADVERGTKLGVKMFLVKAVLSLDEIVDAAEMVLNQGKSKTS
jgi:DNA-binding response OmpR family regulator